jgi:Zn-dependent M28 family amino/carboxypeptidase
MLFAHWDTRPFADRDTQDKGKPILGANDGGSGVGVILELVRAIMQDSLKPKVGIDFVFFDVEDYGQVSGAMTPKSSNTWCLGSQYWGSNLPDDFIKPKYGILLDMVGAKNAVFPRETESLKYNASLVSTVWFLAENLGYGKYFIQDVAGGITDDHGPVSVLAGIPSIDIIHYDPTKRDFGHFHHRHSDNMDVIDRSTLKAVGETMLEVIYREK